MAINENINLCEDYVSFETAKLLKEKGFNYVYCCAAYNKDGSFFWHSDYSRNWKGVVDSPTLQMAMKWLRDVHNIFIGISVCERYENPMDEETKIMFFFELLNLKDKEFIYGYSQDYVHTYEEACEAAIKYCLENLI